MIVAAHLATVGSSGEAAEAAAEQYGGDTAASRFRDDELARISADAVHGNRGSHDFDGMAIAEDAQCVIGSGRCAIVAG
ncbi:hypothetical protein ACQHIV_37780 [Kribbella sp. GL6]|uniref:hypothetical protein n=1 Tax=Kribbella sp. GL6 TaxID=3419765 RepID=UPI003D025CD4